MIVREQYYLHHRTFNGKKWVWKRYGGKAVIDETAGTFSGILGKEKLRTTSEWNERSHTQNISLLENFSMPLSASIVIYARLYTPWILDTADPLPSDAAAVNSARSFSTRSYSNDDPWSGSPYQAGREEGLYERRTSSTFRLSCLWLYRLARSSCVGLDIILPLHPSTIIQFVPVNLSLLFTTVVRRTTILFFFSFFFPLFREMS